MLVLCVLGGFFWVSRRQERTHRPLGSTSRLLPHPLAMSLILGIDPDSPLQGDWSRLNMAAAQVIDPGSNHHMITLRNTSTPPRATHSASPPRHPSAHIRHVLRGSTHMASRRPARPTRQQRQSPDTHPRLRLWQEDHVRLRQLSRLNTGLCPAPAAAAPTRRAPRSCRPAGCAAAVLHARIWL